jgi:hypothetical protein
MNESAALWFIAAAVAANRFEFTYHAFSESLPARRLSVDDVRCALGTATAAEVQNSDATKWKVYGRLLNGDELAVVVRLRGDRVVVIITAHPPP